MNTIYIVTTGDYSDYSIHSVWTDKSEAERVVKAYNSGKSYSEAALEEHCADTLGDYQSYGYCGTYDFAKHGYPVDVKNIEIAEALVAQSYNRQVRATVNHMFTALATTEEIVRRLIFDATAELAAKLQGLDSDPYYMTEDSSEVK